MELKEYIGKDVTFNARYEDGMPLFFLGFEKTGKVIDYNDYQTKSLMGSVSVLIVMVGNEKYFVAEDWVVSVR